eukprot:2273171-Alexandrium_andersonii.AAC.1
MSLSEVAQARNKPESLFRGPGTMHEALWADVNIRTRLVQRRWQDHSQVPPWQRFLQNHVALQE